MLFTLKHKCTKVLCHQYSNGSPSSKNLNFLSPTHGWYSSNSWDILENGLEGKLSWNSKLLKKNTQEN